VCRQPAGSRDIGPCSRSTREDAKERNDTPRSSRAAGRMGHASSRSAREQDHDQSGAGHGSHVPSVRQHLSPMSEIFWYFRELQWLGSDA